MSGIKPPPTRPPSGTSRQDLTARVNIPSSPSPVEWACLVIGGYLVLHYSWLMDDAFIYFRYVDNWIVLRAGPVYNAREWVEGYSSPLWFLTLSVFRLTHLNWWILVRLLGLISFFLTWRFLVVTNRRLSPSDVPRSAVVNVPMVYLCFHYGVLSHFTSGLETPLLQLAGAAFALYLVDPHERFAGAIVALSPLIRHDLALPLIMALAFTWFYHRENPRREIMIAAGGGLAWMAFRVIAYADLLPNTFYLKNGRWPAQGWIYLKQSFGDYSLPFFLILFAAILLLLWLRGETKLRVPARLMMLACALPLVGYIVWIGGDSIHYRYLAFPTLLMVASTGGLFERAILRWFPRGALVASIALAAAIAVGTSQHYPRQLLAHPFGLSASPPHELKGKVEMVDHINEAMHHRGRPELHRNPWSSGQQYEQWPQMAQWRRRHPTLPYEALVADYWCVRNYEHYNWYVAQSLGLTDAILSRVAIKEDRPRHRWGLHPLAQELVQIRAEFGRGRGQMSQAVRAGKAPEWVAEELDTISLIERKVYNRHDFRENLQLAFRFPGRIYPPVDATEPIEAP